MKKSLSKVKYFRKIEEAFIAAMNAQTAQTTQTAQKEKSCTASEAMYCSTGYLSTLGICLNLYTEMRIEFRHGI